MSRSPVFADCFSQLYGSTLFLAEGLMTPWNAKIVKITSDPTKEERQIVVNRADKRHISSVVVEENGIPLGYSVVNNFRNVHIEFSYESFTEDNFYSKTTPIEKIVDRFLEVYEKTDQTKSPPIFLMTGTDGTKNPPEGIMTYWDLNRRSVYTYIYTVFVFFEQAMKEEIYARHKNCVSECVFEYIRAKDSRNRRPRSVKAGRSNLRYNISRLYFRELTDFLIKYSHEGIETGSKLPIQSIEAIREIRNSIAHPVNLIVDGDAVRMKQEIHHLRTICSEARNCVLQYDVNPKNTIYSSVLNRVSSEE